MNSKLNRPIFRGRMVFGAVLATALGLGMAWAPWAQTAGNGQKSVVNINPFVICQMQGPAFFACRQRYMQSLRRSQESRFESTRGVWQKQNSRANAYARTTRKTR